MPKTPQARSKKTSQARSPRTKNTRAAKTAKTAKPAARKAAGGSGAKPAKARSAGNASTTNALSVLVEALKSHPQQKSIVSAGQQKDQLLRSLIPLYLARSLDVEVTSGTTSKFWSKLGVTYAAPNAAKALRTHTGYAAETKKGRAITAKGIKYVEQAIAKA
jgi:hypothetical protein